MNQRAGKTHRAAMDNSMADMRLMTSLKNLHAALEDADETEAAFYFEQLIEHIRNGKPMPSSFREAQRILGL